MNPSQPEVTAVVLAGGMGTRIRHLLHDLPKPMAPVAGRPFLEHVVRYLGTFGIRRVILSTGYRAETIEAHFASAELPGMDVRCVREATPLGTAGGFLQAVKSQPDFGGDVWMVLNGDSLVFADFGQFLDAFGASQGEAALLGLGVPDAARFGTLETEPNGELRRFSEKRPGPGLINAGVYLIRRGVLAQFPTKVPLSFETEVFPLLIERGCRILVHPVRAPFLDIGTPESLGQAEDFIAAHQGLLAPVPRSVNPRGSL